MRQRKSKRILTLLVALAVMLSLCTTAYAETESALAEPTASEQAAETAETAEPSAEASPSAAESAEPTETPEPSQPAQSEAPSEPAESENTEEPAGADLSSVNSVSEVAALSDTDGAEGTDGLIINKTASYNEDGSYTITLEQYVTGSVQTITSTKPADIVLVLDVSGSMDDTLSTEYVYTETYSVRNNGTYYYIKVGDEYTQVHYQWWNWGSTGYWYYGSDNNRKTVTPKTSANDSDSTHVQFYTRTTETTTKLDALKSAVNNFIDSVAENASSNDVDHRIAIVKYACGKTNSVGNDTYSGHGHSGSCNYTQIVAALSDAKTNEQNLENAVKGLTAAGATRSDYGMDLAQTVLNSATDEATDEGRTKVVVMFTDGKPTTLDTFDNEVANGAISAAKSIKDSGATVYTIGMMEDANDGFPLPSGQKDVNRYMHLVSSNYPDATSMSDTGNMADGVGGDTEKSFYLAADSADKLNDIFQQISHSVVKPSLELGEKTVVKDTVTQYFNMPNAIDVNVYTANCTGKNGDTYTFGEREEYTEAEVGIKDNAITVTNFDYATNFVGQDENNDYRGQKLIVEFTITPKDGFLGGNNVRTNGDDSGIYANSKAETAIKNYTIPEVNVPVKEIAVDVVDKNVYLYGDVTQEDMLKDATVKVQDTYEKDIELNLSDGVANLGLETWQNEFVTITVTELQGQTDLTDDSTFTLSASMAPKAAATTEIGPKNTETKTDSDNANIFVFKPVLTFKDGEVDYLDDAPTNYNVYKVGETVWKHGTASSTDEGVKILGGKPTLDLTYTPGDGITDRVITSKDTDIPVQVTVKINEKNATEYTKFEHQACDPACVWSNDKEDGNPAFLLHPKNTVLTIAKTVSGGEANPNDHFEFTITGGEALKGRTVNAAITGADGCSEGHNHGINNAKLSFDENGKATVYLKHGEKITIEGLKAGEVTIAEDNGDYTLTAEVNGTEAEVNNSSIDATLSRGETTEAELNNELGGNPITGIDSDNAPFIIIGAAVVICAAGFVFLRRRRGRSDF
ncbi:MAG: VWA domain-containing protein [Christensenellaceae bacterium]